MEVDKRVVELVEEMVRESVKEEQYKLVVGVALESMRLDLL